MEKNHDNLGGANKLAAIEPPTTEQNENTPDN